MLIPENREGEALQLAVRAVGVYGPKWDRQPPAEARRGIERVLAEDALIVREAVVLEGHTEQLTSLAYRPDGSQLATGSEDHQVRLWDAATGRARATLDHEDSVFALSYSPDGSRLATASKDGAVRLWNPDEGSLMVSLRGPTDAPVGSLAFSSDGMYLVSGSQDGTIRVWGVMP